MRRFATHLAISLFFVQATLFGDAVSLEEEKVITTSQKPFHPFTGKITRDKVRMRLQPCLDSSVVREVDSGDMVVVTGEEDAFYAIQAPSDLKGYVYRTFILDGVVEGNRVNVRLDPHLEAPVITQLNQGDFVEGILSPENNKWLEIPLPARTRFYIASDYIEKIGEADFLAQYEKRKEEVSRLLDAARSMAESELKKQFTSMEADKVIQSYNKVIDRYEDFPECVKQAKQRLATFQETYLEKKVAYLEAKTHADETWTANHDKQSKNVIETQEQIVSSEPHQEDALRENSVACDSGINPRMAQWMPIELSYYERWANNDDNPTIQRFYEEQKCRAVDLKGILELYDRPVRNKPGDYILVDRRSRLPLAYLYSTQVNLQEKVGQEIAVVGVKRPNHYFAYPAYFVLSAE